VGFTNMILEFSMDEPSWLRHEDIFWKKIHGGRSFAYQSDGANCCRINHHQTLISTLLWILTGQYNNSTSSIHFYIDIYQMKCSWSNLMNSLIKLILTMFANWIRHSMGLNKPHVPGFINWSLKPYSILVLQAQRTVDISFFTCFTIIQFIYLC
jgi:hypothetical protein